MKILIIGGTGHIGSFLVPMLADKGEEVTVVSRSRTSVEAPGWKNVKLVRAVYKRNDREWCNFIDQIEFDVLIDILGNDVPMTYEAAKPHCQHYIACGSLWMFGPPKVVPTPEITQGTCSFESYAARYAELLSTQERAQTDTLAFTAIMPPNICGPGKIPLDCHGGRALEVHKAHMQGKTVKLPDGCNTLIGPCDAEDIAQAFFLAVCKPDVAAGQIFNVGSAYALPAVQFIEVYAKIHNSKIPIEFVSSEVFLNSVLPDMGANYHFTQHMLPDIAKIRSNLGYEPKYTPEETMERAVKWMRDHGLL